MSYGLQCKTLSQKHTKGGAGKGEGAESLTSLLEYERYLGGRNKLSRLMIKGSLGY